MNARRTRLGRLRAAVAAVAAAEAVPQMEIWLPLKDGGTEVPGRYSMPGGKAVIVLFDPNDPALAEEIS